MERFIIDPKNISPESIKQDFIDYLNTRLEALKWKGFFESSAGQLIVNFITGYAAFLIYHLTVGRREAYLTSAENRSSHIGIAQNLSYSVFRGRNATLDITMTAVEEPLIFRKWDIIGSVSDRDVIVLEDIIINTGFSGVVRAIIGSIGEEEILVDSNILKPFRFKSSNVSEDIELYFNNELITFTKQIKDLTDRKHVLISNPFGSVDLYYLNDQEPIYDTGDIFKIKFIRFVDLNFVLQDVQLFNSEVVSVVISSLTTMPEDNNAIKVNAPLYFETQFKIRGRNDFKKFFRTLDPSIIDTNGRDYSPSVVELSYVRDNLENFSITQKQAFLETLSSDLPFGVVAPFISNPERSEIGLNINISLKRSVLDPSNQVRQVLSAYEKKLQLLINYEELEEAISDLGFVRSIRISSDLKVRANTTFYQKRDFVVETLNCGEPKFEFFKHIRKSGSTEPLWPTVEGQTVVDGRIVWQARDDSTCQLPVWEANRDYQLGDRVIRTEPNGLLVFVCVKRENVSASALPTWDIELGAITNDRQLIWQTVEITGSPSLWQPNASYETGDTVLPFIDAEVAVQVVGYRSQSGVTPPVFPSSENIFFEDGEILWVSRNREGKNIRLDWNEYAIIKESVVLS
jgi:hypothetical protein